MKAQKLIIIQVLLLLILQSCEKVNPTLDSQTIIDEFEIIDQNETGNRVDSMQIDLLTDTLKQNIPLNYSEFITVINTKFDSLEKINTNSKTIKFLKAFYLAEACFALHSKGFLGKKYGLFESNKITKNWRDYELEQQYQLANSNELPLQCEEISIFYRKLLEQTTSLKSRDTSIIGVHTYPIVSIENNEYIIDPYDPTLILSNNNKILAFEAIKKTPEQAIPKRVKNKFGEKHFLLSKPLYDSLMVIDTNLSSSIRSLLGKLEKKLRNETMEIYHTSKNLLIRPVVSSCCYLSSNQIYKVNYNSDKANKNFISLYFGQAYLKRN